MVNRKFSKFKELEMTDFVKVMNKVKFTFCENDPFPIREVKDATNFGLLQKLYFDIVKRSLTEAPFLKLRN